MADEFDVDDLLEAPYQKVKSEEAEVNMDNVFFCFVSHLNQNNLHSMLYALSRCRCHFEPIIYPSLFI